MVLKEARVLSDNEMKHLFGGSGSSSEGGCTASATCGVSCSGTKECKVFTTPSGVDFAVLCINLDGSSSVGNCK